MGETRIIKILLVALTGVILVVFAFFIATMLVRVEGSRDLFTHDFEADRIGQINEFVLHSDNALFGLYLVSDSSLDNIEDLAIYFSFHPASGPVINEKLERSSMVKVNYYDPKCGYLLKSQLPQLYAQHLGSPLLIKFRVASKYGELVGKFSIRIRGRSEVP